MWRPTQGPTKWAWRSPRAAFLGRFFDRLAENLDLPEILEDFQRTDQDIQTRQIGMVTCEGRTLAFTGDRCSHWAGHRTGEGCSCQGNTLVGAQVIDEMARAIEDTPGPRM